jgi:hypothetical protein
MSASASAVPTAPAAPATAAPAKPLSAIQVVEQEIVNFARQEENAVSQLHAIKGAIQAANFLLNRLKSEEQKAVAFAKAEFEKAQAAATPFVAEVETKVAELVTDVKSAL